ncbi:hypothetical protein [Rivihabitans pingtungensis]|uniref:hypothetical protein n=1 Tax=Rivihabitans pingtungensis TaxID=1054498 RepID=UPI002352ABBF|nr:hypothetical protein [Rivihabitans pingtungensis]MCK6437430.1 hypothetical protein [Rivihabitans pingtungensis]
MFTRALLAALLALTAASFTHAAPAAQHGQAWNSLAALKGKYFADKPASRVLAPVLKKLLGKHYAAFDPGARQASAFRPGKDSADTVGVLWAVSAASAAVRCIGG